MQAIRSGFFRWAGAGLLVVVAPLLGGCTTTGLLLTAAGVATDTSMTWEIVKHVHAKMTEGGDMPCHRLDSVERALNVRCGAFVPGSIRIADLQGSKLQGCALTVAVRDPRFWPALPEFIANGASPEGCSRSPLVELAQSAALARQACPDFAAASPAVLESLRWLADADARSIHHDVVRMLSCPSAVRAGLDRPLASWFAQGDLDVGKVAFGPLGALHPDYLGTPFAQALEASGHTARAGLGGFDGLQPRGFEVALRTSHWAALDWWIGRVPELANRVPPVQGNQLPWVPLARVLTPDFLSHPASQTDMVKFLLAHGANPWQKLPYDAGSSVVHYARVLKSPQLALLDPPTSPAAPTLVATAFGGPDQ